MSNLITILTPVGKPPRTVRPLANRPDALNGLRIGMLDNTKTNADLILNRVQAHLTELGIRDVVRRRKPTASLGAPPEMWRELAACDAVVIALGD